jgi:flagellar basal body-associated protein FliL
MKTSTIVLIIVGVLVLIGAIVAIVMLTKKKDNTAANIALANVLAQPIEKQGGALQSLGGGILRLF